jgi:hypothetical protein
VSEHVSDPVREDKGISMDDALVTRSVRTRAKRRLQDRRTRRT